MSHYRKMARFLVSGAPVIALFFAGCATTENYQPPLAAYVIQRQQEAKEVQEKLMVGRSTSLQDLAKAVVFERIHSEDLTYDLVDDKDGSRALAEKSTLRYVPNESEGGGHWWVRFKTRRDSIWDAPNSFYGRLYRWKCSWEPGEQKAGVVSVTVHTEVYETAGDWSEGNDLTQLKSMGSDWGKFLAKGVSGGKFWKFVKWLPKKS